MRLAALDEEPFTHRMILQTGTRGRQQVDMIGDHHPSKQLVEMSLADNECMTRRQVFGHVRLRRERAPEAPSEEQVSAIWMEMG
jgi:hypothetical protein